MKGDVFSSDMIEAYIELKMEDVTRLRMTTHPVEFDMYPLYKISNFYLKIRAGKVGKLAHLVL